MPTKLEKFQKLLEITNEGLTREEFLSAIKTVINQVLQIEAKVLDKVNKAVEEYKNKQENLSSSIKESLDNLQNKVIQDTDKLFEEQKQNLNFLNDKIKNIKNGKNGEDGKPGQDGKDAIIDEPKIIQKVLNKIELPEIEIEKIKGLKEILDRLETQRRLGGGGGLNFIALQQHFINDETPSGAINGVTVAFTIAHTPNPTNSLKVFVNGSRMRVTEDYTFSGRTITFIIAPPTGSILLVDYMK